MTKIKKSKYENVYDLISEQLGTEITEGEDKVVGEIMEDLENDGLEVESIAYAAILTLMRKYE